MANQPWLDRYGSGLPGKPCRRRISRDSWKNCPIILKISRGGKHGIGRIFGWAAGTSCRAAVAAYRRRSFFSRHPILTFPLVFLVFAISPTVLYTFLSFILPLLITAIPCSIGSFAAHFGPTAESLSIFLFQSVVPAVVAGLLYR